MALAFLEVRSRGCHVVARDADLGEGEVALGEGVL
jgi:hypothetical protein